MNPPPCWPKTQPQPLLCWRTSCSLPCDVQAAGDDPYGLALATSLPPPACPTSQLIHQLASFASVHVLFSFLGTLGGGGQRTHIRLERSEGGSAGKKVTFRGAPPGKPEHSHPPNMCFSSVYDRRAGPCSAHDVIIGDWFRTERSLEKWGIVTLGIQGGLLKGSGSWSLQGQGI